ncbi:hypothetical protein TH0274_14560 [Helicobacter pylori]
MTPPKEVSQESPKNEAQKNEAQKETPQSDQLPKEMKVKSISYVGLSYMSDMLANEIVKIRVGDIVDSKKIDTSVLALFNQGYFKDVYATFESGINVFKIPLIEQSQNRGVYFFRIHNIAHTNLYNFISEHVRHVRKPNIRNGLDFHFFRQLIGLGGFFLSFIFLSLILWRFLRDFFWWSQIVWFRAVIF